jgi:type I restriction enzyme S subunit
MAGEWRPTTLDECIEIKHGFAFKGDFIHDEPRGDVLLTPGNFAIGGGFKGEKFKYYDGPVPEDFVLHEGDLVVTMTDLSKAADTLGYPAFVPACGTGRRYLHNQRLGKVLIKSPDSIDAKFLHYLLCGSYYRHEVLASATGTTVKHTSPERIRRFQFHRPPLPEQRAIAHILGTLDDKIELNRRMNETLEAMARALFKSWFVDFDPVRAKAEGRDPGLPKPLADLFPARLIDSDLGEIPEGWGAVPLYDVATYINGAAYAAFEPNDERRGLPIIKIAELKTGVTTQTKFSAVQMPEKYRISRGDILFSWSGNPDTSIDTFVWSHDAAWLNQHIFRVVPHHPHERAFVLTLLRQLRPVFAEIARNKQTTGLGHVTARDMQRLLVALPNNKVMYAWNALAAPMLDRALLNGVEINSIMNLRDTLLPKLISGELRVKDAERFIRPMS